MRRRRLIGMYRVLLKSMNLVCSGLTKDWDPRRSCREGQEWETAQEPAPESNLSDWPTQHNRSGPAGPSFTRFAATLRAVVLTILSRYLSAQQGRRNEPALTIQTDRNPGHDHIR